MNITLKMLLCLYAATSMAFAQVGMREIVEDGLPITVIYPTEEKVARLQRGAFELNVAVNAKAKVGNRR